MESRHTGFNRQNDQEERFLAICRGGRSMMIHEAALDDEVLDASPYPLITKNSRICYLEYFAQKSPQGK